MRVGVIGAGIAGLVTARRLTRAGHEVDVYERWPGLGGQVATIDVGAPDPLERYYHHLFTSDREIVALYEELGMGEELEWRPSSMAMFTDGIQYPFTSPLDLLRFKPLSLFSRLRMGLAVVVLQRRHRSVEPFESMTAREWIGKQMGEAVWERVWGPLLRGKFGPRAEQVSMAWLWSKFTVRRGLKGKEARQELLGYPRGGWQPLLERLQREIEAGGGRVLIDTPAARLRREGDGVAVDAGAPDSFRRGHDPREFETAGSETYDAIVSTVPSDVFLELLDDSLSAEMGDAYLEKVRRAEYQEALCVLLELDRRFSDFYWTNIAQPGIPFIGLIEHTNLIEPERYDGRRFLYIANYLPHGDPLLELGHDELLERYLPGIRAVNPEFSLDWVLNRWVFREPAAQPIVMAGHHERIPEMRSPAPGVWLANTMQIYPEDRGTNYSVRLGEDVAREMLKTGG